MSSLILSTYAEGPTAPGAPAYAIAAGTSFSAPLVTGTVSLMLARNSSLTSGRVLSILAGHDAPVPVRHDLRRRHGLRRRPARRGAGGRGDASRDRDHPAERRPGHRVLPADIDHYFITGGPNEVAFIDTFLRDTFQRTG